jgi:hypothetical protein
MYSSDFENINGLIEFEMDRSEAYDFMWEFTPDVVLEEDDSRFKSLLKEMFLQRSSTNLLLDKSKLKD